MKFKLVTTITKEYLLSKNSQETYLTYYLGLPVKKGLFRSPLRQDEKPTCAFYVNKKGDIIFKDFNGSFSGNFINVVIPDFPEGKDISDYMKAYGRDSFKTFFTKLFTDAREEWYNELPF